MAPTFKSLLNNLEGRKKSGPSLRTTKIASTKPRKHESEGIIKESLQEHSSEDSFYWSNKNI